MAETAGRGEKGPPIQRALAALEGIAPERCTARTLTDPRGRLVATLATRAPHQRMTLAARRHLHTLRRATDQISDMLDGAE
ncbi:MAG: hypothetical protein OEU09_10350 [Rhodospirillales bacterium]|nr:hypothetical protein [Rhodospirillales bacterium]MDH3917675.1 hypothetical protein [Rhodospirillales bacterium]MDH3968802.1 hypothetical protein [Rhodospirillales bacterium]